MTRKDLEATFNRPKFDQLITHFFVRVGAVRDREKVFRASEIVGVKKGMRSYKFAGKTTNKALILRYGTVERDYALEYISNSLISDVSCSFFLFINENMINFIFF